VLYKIVVIVTLLGLFAHASDRPSWIDQPQLEDSQSLYYIGRANNVRKEAQAFREATTNAYKQAIQENFGIYTQIKTSTCETLTGSKILVHSQSKSGIIQITNFIQVRYHIELNSQGYVNLWVLFRYNKTAIMAEKIRIRHFTKIQPSINYIPAEIQCPKTSNKKSTVNTIEVTTRPSDWILGIKFGIGGSSIDRSTTMSELNIDFTTKLLWQFNLQIGITGRIGKGGKKFNTDTFENSLTGLEVYAGLLFKLSKLVSLVPKIGIANYTYSHNTQVTNSYGIAKQYKKQRYSLMQPFVGGDLSFNASLSNKYNLGWTVNIGAKKYRDTDLFKGSVNVSANIGIRFGL